MKPTPPNYQAFFNALLKFVVGCAAVAGLFFLAMNRVLAGGYVIHCQPWEGGLKIGKMLDKPWVLTHIQVGGAFGALEPPLARVESGSINISAAKLRKMKWFMENGEETSPPASFENARAIYYFPERTERKSSDD